jgi:FAD/FMN-containing dehydrogenase
LAEKANLRHDLEAWRTKQFSQEELKGFDMKNLLDKGCQVILSANEDGKVRLSGVASLSKGTTLPERVNELKYFDIYEFDEEEFDALSDKFKDMVKDSREYKEIAEWGHILTDEERKNGENAARSQSNPADDSDIPF